MPKEDHLYNQASSERLTVPRALHLRLARALRFGPLSTRVLGRVYADVNLIAKLLKISPSKVR